MALVDFTSYADIRAALGVVVDEIQDEVISLPIYENNLGMALDAIDLALIADHGVVKAKLLGARTANETRFMRAMQLYTTYVVARQLTTSLPLFSPKEINDGKASLVRYAQNPFETTIKGVLQLCETYRLLVISSYGALKQTAEASQAIRSYFNVVTPSYNPVTGV